MKTLINTLLLLCTMLIIVQNTTQAETHIVEVSDFEYSPANLTIALGDTVHFEWVSGNHPTASGVDGTNDETFMAFPINENNPSYDLILGSPGTYPYFCVLHWEIGMIGSITVTPVNQESCSNLFFSEYIEGSSQNKALEIYNPTESEINLETYSISRYNNGATMPSGSETLSGTVLPGEVFIIAHPDADPILVNQADYISNTIPLYNGNDALELYNNGLLIDVIGQVGEDPGEAWEVGEGGTEEFTLVRKASVSTGQTDWAVGATEWDVFPQNYFENINGHANDECFVNQVVGCTNVFISEYVEGTDNNKAIEIYNPQPIEVDLSEYTLERYNNSSTEPSFSYPLTDVMVGPFGTFAIAHPSADETFSTNADAFSDLVVFSGDDAIALKKGDEIIDVIGEIGADPGAFWIVGDGNTIDFTLVRKIDVTTGTTDWVAGAEQWDAFPLDYADNFGGHISNCGSAAPLVSFAETTMDVNEGAGSITVQIEATNIDQCYTFTLGTSGTAAQDTDYTFAASTIEVCEDSEIEVPISFIDDMEEEEIESLFLFLTDPSDGLAFGDSELEISIIDNDQPIVDIATATATDADGVATMVGEQITVEGIVYGVNLRPGGLQFALIDDTDGIAVFNQTGDLGYTVTEGDLIEVSGVVDQFRGLTEIIPSQITRISQNNELKPPTLVTTLDEDSELDLVRLRCVQLIEPTEWTNSGTGFNLQVIGDGALYSVRIDEDVNVYGTEPPLGAFDIVGIGWQFASSQDAPFNDGYQLYPRYIEDITEVPTVADFNYEVEDLTIAVNAIEDTSIISYEWSFGDGQSAFGQIPEPHTYNAPGTYTVTLVVENSFECAVFKSVEIMINNVGIEEISQTMLQNVEVYPNPAQNKIVVDMTANTGEMTDLQNTFDQITIMDLSGKELSNHQFAPTNQKQLDINHLMNGLYLVKIASAERSVVKKINVIK